MAGPDRTGPGPTDDAAPADHRPSRRGHKPSPGASQALVQFVADIAGGGTVDERCARILAAFGPRWFGDPTDQEHEP